jgi:hypothetical protein
VKKEETREGIMTKDRTSGWRAEIDAIRGSNHSTSTVLHRTIRTAAGYYDDFQQHVQNQDTVFHLGLLAQRDSALKSYTAIAWRNEFGQRRVVRCEN